MRRRGFLADESPSQPRRYAVGNQQQAYGVILGSEQRPG
jgi:hypothetical protein